LPIREAVKVTSDGLIGTAPPTFPFRSNDCVAVRCAGMGGARAPEANVWVYVIAIHDVLVESTNEGIQYVVAVGYG